MPEEAIFCKGDLVRVREGAVIGLDLFTMPARIANKGGPHDGECSHASASG